MVTSRLVPSLPRKREVLSLLFFIKSIKFIYEITWNFLEMRHEFKSASLSLVFETEYFNFLKYPITLISDKQKWWLSLWNLVACSQFTFINPLGEV